MCSSLQSFSRPTGLYHRITSKCAESTVGLRGRCIVSGRAWLSVCCASYLDCSNYKERPTVRTVQPQNKILGLFLGLLLPYIALVMYFSRRHRVQPPPIWLAYLGMACVVAIIVGSLIVRRAHLRSTDRKEDFLHMAAMGVGSLLRQTRCSVAFWMVATYFCAFLGLVIGQVLVYRVYRDRVVAAH